MTKRQLVDEITMRNPTAKADFLARFEEADLGAYLNHLIAARRPRLSNGGNQYAKYFVSAARTSAQAEPSVCSGPVRGFSDDRLPTELPPLTTARPMNDDAQAEDLPLERPEPLKAIQPALFATPVADMVDVSAQDESLPAEKSAWRESQTPAQVAASETDCDAGADEPAEIEMEQISTPVPSEAAAEAQPTPVAEEIEELPQDQPAQAVEATTGSHQGQFAPIVLFQSARRQEPVADEIEQEEIVAQEQIEEDLPLEESAEELIEEAGLDEETPTREKLQPVAVGAERQSNNNQETDSWLF